MKRWMIQTGSVFGIKVYAHVAIFLFVLTAIFLGQGTMVGCEFLVIFFHEMGHALIARAVHMQVDSMEVTPFGCVAKIGGYMELSPIKEAAIAIAGPAVNLFFIMATAYAVTVIFPKYPPPEAVYSFLNMFMNVNIMIMLFNLLPALPMDGGRIIRAITAPLFGLSRATKWCSVLGMTIGLLMGIWGILCVFYGAFNITFFTVGSYLFYAASRERRTSPLLMIESVSKKKDRVKMDVMTIRSVITNPDITVGELLSRFTPHHYHVVTVVDEHMNKIAKISEQQLISAWLSHGPLLPIGQLSGRTTSK